MSAADAGPGPDLPTLSALVPDWGFYAIPWAAGLLVAIVAVSWRRLHPLRALGLGILTVPVWDTLVGIVDSFGPLLQGGFVLQAFTTHQLSGLYSNKFLGELGHVAAGYLLYAAGPNLFTWRLEDVARRLRADGLPLWRSEGRSTGVAVLGFPLLLVGTIAFSVLFSRSEALNQSDESSVFANMTLYHALMISLAAAFGEELVYRGVLQVGLFRVLGGSGGASGSRRPAALVVAVLVQAVVFGFAHAGYATWSHVLLPTLFGLVAGIVAVRFGIWAAIVLHTLVDIYAFGAEVGGNLLGVLTLAFGLNLFVGLVWVLARGVTWWSHRRTSRAA